MLQLLLLNLFGAKATAPHTLEYGASANKQMCLNLRESLPLQVEDAVARVVFLYIASEPDLPERSFDIVCPCLILCAIK